MDRDVGDVDRFLLGVSGQAEYLLSGQLSDYEYVHQCYKYDRDVRLCLACKSDIARDLARTASDDQLDSDPGFDQISPLDTLKTLSYDELKILLACLQKEADRMSATARTLASCSDKEVMKALRPKQMLQAVKAAAVDHQRVKLLTVPQDISDTGEPHPLDGDQAQAGQTRPHLGQEHVQPAAAPVAPAPGGDSVGQARGGLPALRGRCPSHRPPQAARHGLRGGRPRREAVGDRPQP